MLGWWVLGLAVAAAVLRRRAAVASAVHRLWRAVPSSYVAGCRPLARGSRRVASAARLLSLSAQSLFARGQLSRYGFRAAVVDYERSLSSLRAARAAVRQKARGGEELASGDTLASTLSAAAARIQPPLVELPGAYLRRSIPVQLRIDACSEKASRTAHYRRKTNTAPVGARTRRQTTRPKR